MDGLTRTFGKHERFTEVLQYWHVYRVVVTADGVSRPDRHISAVGRRNKLYVHVLGVLVVRRPSVRAKVYKHSCCDHWLVYVHLSMINDNCIFLIIFSH